jgi:N-acetylmuramoyl-L-alanine amidase
LASNVDLPIATNVRNQAISLSARSELSQVNTDTISKPQTTQAASVASHELTTYKTKQGDTVDSVATQFGLSKDTIKWSNNIQGDALEPGRDLAIPPVDGLVATAQSGDTAASLAQKYGSTAERVLLFNDVDASGAIVAGTQVVIPGGQVVAPPAPAPTRSGGSVSTVVNFASLNATGNGYDYGYCTWYAYNRRAALGKPIGGMWGNASSWAALARASGFSVNSTPEIGAVMQTAYAAGGYGHVAVVEAVNPDGSIMVSEMNYAGWNRKSSRTVPASEVPSYNYIH